MEEPIGTGTHLPANIGDTLPASSGHTVATVETDDFMIKVQKCVEPMTGAAIYPMQSNPRGFCLIFNCFEFSDILYPKRLGSETETKRLNEIFTQLHFSVKVFDNLIKKDIDSKVDEYSQSPDLVRHDAIIVVVLSHGKSGGFAASDGNVIQFQDIVEKLNNKNCSNLINKPKIFWFSCCRGDYKDFGVKHTIQALNNMQLNDVSDTVVIDQQSDTALPIRVTVPMVSDIMICYSTIDGHVSWRCTDQGTWLGMVLSQVLAKHSHDTDLLQMLTYMSHSINEKEFGFGGAKQVIEVILRGFKKTFYFNPGYFLTDQLSSGDQH